MAESCQDSSAKVMQTCRLKRDLRAKKSGLNKHSFPTQDVSKAFVLEGSSPSSPTPPPGSRTLGLECPGVQDGPDYREPCAVSDSVSHGGGQASRLWERGGPCLGQGFYWTALTTHSKAQRLAVPVSEPKQSEKRIQTEQAVGMN